MNWIDIVCLVCISIFALFGLWRGFLKSIFKITAWIGAIVGAYVAQSLLSDVIARNLEASGFTVTLICICIGFLVPFLLLNFIGHILHKTVSDSSVSGVNRALGALLGIIKASLICFVFLTIMHLIPASGDLRETRNSAVSYAVYKASIELMGFSSEEVNLIDAAEKKATEIGKELSEKAIDAAKESATAAADAATNAAKESAAAAVDAATNAVKDGASATVDAAKNKVMGEPADSTKPAASSKQADSTKKE